MPNPKKKKLESAINNLFSTPRPKPDQSQPTTGVADGDAPPPPSQGDPEIPAEKDSIIQEDTILTNGFAEKTKQAENLIPFAESPVITLRETVVPDGEIIVAEVLPGPAVQPAAPTAPAKPLPADSHLWGNTVQMVIFLLDKQYYGIGIESVDSIIKVQKITELPRAPHYIVGLTNLRGKVLPVISLRRRFGLTEEEATKDSRIIVINIDQKEAGLIVDGVSEVESIPGESIEPSPSMIIGSDSRPIDGIAKLGDRLIILLNLLKVISPES